MKLFLEITIRGVIDDIRVRTEVRHKIDHDLSGTYYGHELFVEECQDPDEAYNRGYDNGFSQGMATCETQHD